MSFYRTYLLAMNIPPAQTNVSVGDELRRAISRGCFSPLRPGLARGVDEIQPAASGSGRCYQALTSSSSGRPLSTASSNSGQKMITEKLWRDLLSDPSQWWDHRAEKGNPRYPDFKHKETTACLWINGRLNPTWVEAELAAMPSSTSLQEHPFSWNKRLARYVKARQYDKALDHFHQMQTAGVRPDRHTFIAAIKACAKLGSPALEEGRYVHSLVHENGYESNFYLSSSLVDMYARCGSIEDAQREFERMPMRDVVAWNAIILGHVKCEQAERAWELTLDMRSGGVEPDAVTFVGMLNACASMAALDEGRRVHEQVAQLGLDSSVFVGSSLVDMYARCGRIDDARCVFDKIPARDVVCWNAMIQGYVKCGEGGKALAFSAQMEDEGVEPNSATFVALLNACAGAGALAKGRSLHEQATHKGVDFQVIVGNSLIHMYGECGSIHEAWRVFNRMPTRNVLSWNAMIEGFLMGGEEKHALELYWEIYRQDVEPDSDTFVAALTACARLAARREGRRVHESIARRGLESVPSVSVGLIEMYAGCKKIDRAWMAFDEMPVRDVRSYNAMLEGCLQCGQLREALQLKERMQLENVEPDVETFVALLEACGMVGALEEGQGLHAQIRARGLEADDSLKRSLSRMYAKCERIVQLRTVYDKLPRHDEVSLLTKLGG